MKECGGHGASVDTDWVRCAALAHVWILAAALVIGGVGIARAADGPPETAAPLEESAAPLEGWAYDLANELMSPFCPGRTLAECPSGKADSLRMWIIIQEAAGRPRDEVESELYERYGDVIRPAPLAQGIGLAAYIAPVVVFLLGGAVVAVFLRVQKRRPREATRMFAAPSDPELERILDDELAR